MNTRRQNNTPNRAGGAQVQQQQQQPISRGASYGNAYSQQQQQQQQQAQETQELKPIVGGTQSTTPVENSNGEATKKVKPEWQNKKIDPALRRLRQNARVKRVVKPKTAIMVLHEMYPDIVYKIDEVTNNKTSIYRVHFELTSKQYSGEGFSKSQAKQNACENALKSLLLEKVAQEQADPTSTTPVSESAKADAAGENMETDDDSNNTKKTPATDDFPWGKLASFALQKLMDSCTNKGGPEGNGFPIPPVTAMNVGGFGPNHVSFSNFSSYPAAPQPQQVFHQRESVFPNIKKPIASPRKKFPENPLEYNPVALYNQTWPQTEPSFDSKTNPEGKPVHTATLSLEGFRFSASGKSKKEVKTQICKAVISTLKGVKYPDGFQATVIQA